MRQTVESSPRTQNLPVEQRERIIEQQTRLAPVFGYVMAAVGMPIVALVTAAVLLFVFKLMLDAQLTFRQVFAVTCYFFLRGVFSVALSILVMFLKNPEDFNLQDPLGAHLGSLLDPETAPKWLAALASSFDLFSVMPQSRGQQPVHPGGIGFQPVRTPFEYRPRQAEAHPTAPETEKV